MQLLIKIQIYNKNNNAWQNLYHTPYQPSTNMILESRVDMGWDTDWAMYYSLYITRWIKKARPNTRWDLATGDIPKKHRLRRIDARTVYHRYWLVSYERLNKRSTKYKHKYSFDLECFETKRNVDNILFELQKHSV